MDLRPYQREGVDCIMRVFAKGGRFALLADEPGLGKTAQAISVAKSLNASSLLVVCPASLRLNWRKEIEMWEYKGSATVMSYEEAVKRAGDLQGLFVFSLAVFDEAHYLKSPNAKRTKACFAVSAERMLFLTGTPVVNRPIELYPMLHAMGIADSYNDYGREFCDGHLRKVPGGHGRMCWDFTGASNILKLSCILSRFMVRRLKADVLTDLPPKTRQVIPLDMDSGETAGYRKAMVPWLEADNLGRTAAPVPFDALALERQRVGLMKAPEAARIAKDILEEESSLVVMAYHRAVLDALMEALSGYSPVMVRGGMSDADKNESVMRFQSGASRVFIGQIQAAGTGLTLTAAKTLLFAEEDWVPGTMTQAEDRIHRIGQSAPVRIIHIAANGSVDHLMIRTLISKQQTIEEIVKATSRGETNKQENEKC